MAAAHGIVYDRLEDIIPQAVELIRQGCPWDELGSYFGCNSQTIVNYVKDLTGFGYGEQKRYNGMIDRSQAKTEQGVKEYIAEQARQELRKGSSLIQIAGSMGISRSMLQRVFDERYGVPALFYASRAAFIDSTGFPADEATIDRLIAQAAVGMIKRGRNLPQISDSLDISGPVISHVLSEQTGFAYQAWRDYMPLIESGRVSRGQDPEAYIMAEVHRALERRADFASLRDGLGLGEGELNHIIRKKTGLTYRDMRAYGRLARTGEYRKVSQIKKRVADIAWEYSGMGKPLSAVALQLGMDEWLLSQVIIHEKGFRYNELSCYHKLIGTGEFRSMRAIHSHIREEAVRQIGISREISIDQLADMLGITRNILQSHLKATGFCFQEWCAYYDLLATGKYRSVRQMKLDVVEKAKIASRDKMKVDVFAASLGLKTYTLGQWLTKSTGLDYSDWLAYNKLLSSGQFRSRSQLRRHIQEKVLDAAAGGRSLTELIEELGVTKFVADSALSECSEQPYLVLRTYSRLIPMEKLRKHKGDIDGLVSRRVLELMEEGKSITDITTEYGVGDCSLNHCVFAATGFNIQDWRRHGKLIRKHKYRSMDELRDGISMMVAAEVSRWHEEYAAVAQVAAKEEMSQSTVRLFYNRSAARQFFQRHEAHRGFVLANCMDGTDIRIRIYMERAAELRLIGQNLLFGECYIDMISRKYRLSTDERERLYVAADKRTKVEGMFNLDLLQDIFEGRLDAGAFIAGAKRNGAGKHSPDAQGAVDFLLSDSPGRILTFPETRAYALIYQYARATDPGKAEAYREKLVKYNLPLVVSIAGKHTGMGIDLDDLVQAGSEGLLRSVEKYDWRLGYRFSTYATRGIGTHIRRAIADQSRTIRQPAYLDSEYRRFLRWSAELETRFNAGFGRGYNQYELQVFLALQQQIEDILKKNKGRMPSEVSRESKDMAVDLIVRALSSDDFAADPDLALRGAADSLPAPGEYQCLTIRAGSSAMTKARKKILLYDDINKQQTISLSYKPDGSGPDDDELIDFTPDSRQMDPSEEAALNSLRAALGESMQALSEREQLVLAMRFGFLDESYTLKEAGKMLGMSHENIRLIEKAALEKLRRDMAIGKQHS